MTVNVTPLAVVALPEERRRETIELLERYLAEAKAGKYDEVLICAAHADAEVFTWSWTRSEDLIGLVGRLEKLKFEALRRMDPEPA